MKLMWLCSFHINNFLISSAHLNIQLRAKFCILLFVNGSFELHFKMFKNKTLVYLATRQQSELKTSYLNAQGTS